MPWTVTLFGYGKGIIHLNSEVTDGILDLRVTEQERAAGS